MHFLGHTSDDSPSGASKRDASAQKRPKYSSRAAETCRADVCAFDFFNTLLLLLELVHVEARSRTDQPCVRRSENKYSHRIVWSSRGRCFLRMWAVRGSALMVFS